MSDHAAYVRKLRASIRAEDLSAARASLTSRRRKKTAKGLGKVFAVVGGIGLATAAVVGVAKAGDKR